MEEIDLSELIAYFKSKLVYIILATSIFFCFSSIYVNRFRIPVFTSSTTILLNQANDSIAINTNDLNLNKSLVPTYSEIIKSKRVLSQVINLLNLEYEYSELYNMVKVSEITDTSIIKIAVTDEQSLEAAEIANKIAEVFSKEIVDIYNIENISIIDKAEESEKPSSASAVKIVLICSLVGLFFGIAVFFVIYYFDTSLKSEEDIEKITGLPVIGVVPLSNRNEKTHEIKEYNVKKLEAVKVKREEIKDDELIDAFNPNIKNR